MKNEYIFQIDVFTPETLPMDRLAQYMAALSDLVGHKENTHFARLDKGSACLVHYFDEQAVAKVETRLLSLKNGNATKDALGAYKKLEDMLASDNATGSLRGNREGVVIDFVGRNRPKPLTFPTFKQDGSIDGQIVSIGGKDATSHVILQHGKITYSHISLSRDLARNMGALLYGPTVRLYGAGRWTRSPEGSWLLENFIVDRYETLDDSDLGVILDEIRTLKGNDLMSEDTYHAMMNLRDDGSDTH